MPQELHQDEEVQVQAFIQYLRDQQRFELPEEYWTNDRLLLRILAGEKYNH